MQRREKQSLIKYSVKTTKGRKKVEDKIETKNKDNKQKIVMNMVYINPILILNVSGLNVPIERHIVKSQSENVTQLCIVHKKCTLNIKIFIDKR